MPFSHGSEAWGRFPTTLPCPSPLFSRSIPPGAQSPEPFTAGLMALLLLPHWALPGWDPTLLAQSNFSVAQVLLLWFPLLETSHAWGKELPSSQKTPSGVPPLCPYLPDLESSVLFSLEDPWDITTAVPRHGSAECAVHWGPGKAAGPVPPAQHS